MRRVRSKKLMDFANAVTVVGGVKKSQDFYAIRRRLYRRMKKDWREGRRDGFRGIL